MKKAVKIKLLRSLTATDIRLLPYIPYLLQDIWSLGTPVNALIAILKRQIPSMADFKALDLGCGKGAAALEIARRTGAHVHMVDGIPAFIKCAREKAKKMHLSHLCTFAAEDINRTVNKAKDYDMVLLNEVGNVFGNAARTVRTLKKTVKPGGYIVISDAYLTNGSSDIRLAYDYETLDAWLEAFKREDCIILEHYEESGETYREIDNEYNNQCILKRAEELKKRYPQKAGLFDAYVKSQADETADIEGDSVSGAIWLAKTMG